MEEETAVVTTAEVTEGKPRRKYRKRKAHVPRSVNLEVSVFPEKVDLDKDAIFRALEIAIASEVFNTMKDALVKKYGE